MEDVVVLLLDDDIFLFVVLFVVDVELLYVVFDFVVVFTYGVTVLWS